MRKTKAKKSESLERVIWAADPLEDPGAQRQALRLLRDLAKRTQAVIEPVYVLSDGLLGLSVPKSELVRQMKPAAERALDHLAREAKLPRLAPPKVLVAAPTSRGGAVEALDRYAREKGAELIVANSHGRHGLKRAVLGSFAETLLLHARVPVLVTGPKTQQITRLDHILFPTDFTRASQRAFERVQELARGLKASITLFYVAVNPLEAFVQSGTALLGGGYVTTHGMVEENLDRQKKLAKQWVESARKNGVKADTAFDIDSSSVVLSILDYAQKKKSGLIAMASESSAFSSAVLGSIGRGVAREASCPVWFLRR